MIDQYLDELEVELRRAARRRARLAAARAPRVPAGAIAGVWAVAACAIVAFVLLQVGGAGHSVGGSSGSGGSAAVPAGARALVRELGVFRRPQAAADRIDSPIPHLFVIQSGLRGVGGQNLTVVPSLTRLVANLPGGRRIFLAIGRVSGLAPSAFKPPRALQGLGSPAGRAGSRPKVPAPHYVVVWLELPFVNYVPGQKGERARAVPIGRNQSMLVSPALTAKTLLITGRSSVAPEGIPDDPVNAPLDGPRTWLGIVPDGVVGARWTIQYPGQRRRATVTLPVSNNVALLTVPNGQQDEVWALTWLAADGHVIGTLSYPIAFQ
jgi:hypothetical protein